jgi:hypothetical protein
LPLTFTTSPQSDLVRKVHARYSELMQFARDVARMESGLGGLLLYAGELNSDSRSLLMAANIAGAASLVVTTDRSTQKQAIRDGVVDFLVTSLEEALRILKNEIRKRETVAVCVSAAPSAAEGEMLARGVLPDVLPTGFAIERGRHFVALGAASLQTVGLISDQAIVTWAVTASSAKWLPRLDSLALACLGPNEGASRRWLQVAPRFMGRLAHGMRFLICNRSSGAAFVEGVRRGAVNGEFAVAIEIQVCCNGLVDEFQFSPVEL